MEKQPVIALLGQPNSGKSTLFNHLTGSRQHVGNWPGKTVEKKEGTFTYNGRDWLAADLPGSYSLSANSDEEIITRDYIAGGKADIVCILADASQLERSLYMLADFAGIRVPAILLLNMMDVAEGQGKAIDAGKLEDSPEAVQSALEVLEQMGKVQKVAMSLHCGHKCAGCTSPCKHRVETGMVRWELRT